MDSGRAGGYGDRVRENRGYARSTSGTGGGGVGALSQHAESQLNWGCSPIAVATIEHNGMSM